MTNNLFSNMMVATVRDRTEPAEEGVMTAKPSPRRDCDLPELTAEAIRDAAVRLTREKGLDGWSIRQLAKELKAWPNNISYRVGRRDDAAQLVVDYVMGEIDVPEDTGDWKPWFEELFVRTRKVLRRYPGVARRLAAVGPGLGAANETIHRGISLLERAGFGDRSAEIYSSLMCNVCAFIATEDDRDSMAEARKAKGAQYSQGAHSKDREVASLGKVVVPIAKDETARQRYFDDQFLNLVRALLAGYSSIALGQQEGADRSLGTRS